MHAYGDFYAKFDAIKRSGYSTAANVGPRLAMILSCTCTSYSSVEQEYFWSGDFTIKTKAVVLNFVTSLRTVDLLERVWNFHMACIAHSPFS